MNTVAVTASVYLYCSSTARPTSLIGAGGWFHGKSAANTHTVTATRITWRSASKAGTAAEPRSDLLVRIRFAPEDWESAFQSNCMKHAIIYKRERISRPIVQGFYGRALLRSKRGDLILAPSAPLRVASADAVIAGHLVALDGAAKMQHSARLGGEFDVVPVNEARDGAGLVGPFEMAAQDVAVLLDLD